jgi:hypothetical protein
MIVKFQLEYGLVNGCGPDIEVLVNHLVTKCVIPDTTNSMIEIDIDNQSNNTICFLHKNKTDQDTVVVNGTIVNDKFFKIVKIWVDDILLPDLFCFGQANLIYSAGFLENIDQVPVTDCKSDGLYFNGTLSYYFSENYFDWLYEYYKQQDLEYIQNHPDSEAEEKYLGYQQNSNVEQDIVHLLESNGYRITC